MAWTLFQDVKDSYERPLGDDMEPWVTTVIERAERLLTRKRPSLAANITAGTVEEANVRSAVVNAVLRVIRNPEGYQSETEGNYVYSVARDVAGGKLYFDADDLALATPVATLHTPAMSSVPIGIPAYRVPVLRERWSWP